MKKSKFLKKSLAMLLALMLVVAMIPLSASAAAPVMRQVAAVVGDYTTTLTAGGGGNTYTGVVPNTATEITLRVLVRDGNEVYITDESTATPTEVKGNDDDGDTVWEITTTPGSLSNYENEDGNYEIQFAVVDETAPSDRLDFTAILTPTVVSTDIDIETLTFERVIGNTVIPQWGETTITQEDIYVTIPYDAADHAGYVRIRNMILSTGASAEINGRSYAGVTNSAPPVIVEDEEPIVISNNGNSQTYTLHISIAPGFTSFTTEEGLDAVLFTETGDIAVLLPYGYTTGKDTVTITPSYELDYLSAEAEWANGEAVTVKTANVNKSVFNSFKGTHTTATNDWDWDGAKAESASFYSFIDGDNNWNDVKAVDTVWVQYTDDTTRTYNVYLFETKLNNATAITGLTIGSEQAVIDEENKTIDIVLPAGTDLKQLDMLNDPKTEFTMTASNGAKITFPALVNDSLNETTTSNTGDNRTATDTFFDGWEIDASEPISVLVKSEDNECSGNEQYYTLNITASDNYEDAKITGMSIQSPDGKYTYDATPDANGKIVL